MTNLTLTIGDKNLSSWSLRPWLLMRQTGIPFAEENIRLDLPDTKRVLRERSPSGLVPFLTHDNLVIPDSLAIAEYLNEQFPEKQLWPAEQEARAMARAISAEMHAGFSALRTVWPMNFVREGLKHLTTGGVQRDVDRIDAIWAGSRRLFGADGPFLFGAFSIADAMYAPVVSRFRTYGPLPLSQASLDYMEAITGLPALQDWRAGALEEMTG